MFLLLFLDGLCTNMFVSIAWTTYTYGICVLTDQILQFCTFKFRENMENEG